VAHCTYDCDDVMMFNYLHGWVWIL